MQIYEGNIELKKALDMISTGFFSPEAPDLFRPIVESLLANGDYYIVLADYAKYVAEQGNVSKCYEDQPLWTRMSILNTANMGKFSSDRSIMEYARNIWNVSPLA